MDQATAEANSIYTSWMSALKLLNSTGLHPTAKQLYLDDLTELHQRAQYLIDHNSLHHQQLTKMQILLKRSAAESLLYTQALSKDSPLL